VSKAPEHPAADDGDRDGPAAAQLLDELRVIRERTSAAARGYWLPLVVFGVLIGGSLPLYERLPAGRPGLAGPAARAGCPAAADRGCQLPGATAHITVVTALGYYWQLAIPAGVVLTVLWYRWRGHRVGLRTPARGFLVAGLVLGELVLLGPILAGQAGSETALRLVHDSHQAGALVIVAALLGLLAWAERSPALAVIVAVYLAAALAISPVTNGGVAGGTTGAADLSLTAARLLGLIPALILLAAGAAAGLAQQARLRHTAPLPG